MPPAQALYTTLQIHLTRWSGQPAPDETRSDLIGQIDGLLLQLEGDGSAPANDLRGAVLAIRADLVANADPQEVGEYEVALVNMPGAIRALSG